MNRRATALLALLTLALTGCIKISIPVGSSPGKVRQTPVITEKSSQGEIALIDITGLIGPAPSLFSTGVSIDDTALMLRQAAKDSDIDALILRINSPGGGVAASETLYNLINDFRNTTHKPVVVSMADVAASGGYYIATAADRIVAQPSTVTGSIGVIIPAVNASAGLKSIGIVSTSITSGPNKDLASPVSPVNPHHEAILQSLVDDFYEQFRTKVTTARPDLKDPDTNLDGRVFTGRQALDIGLVDELGGIPEAFAAAKHLANLNTATLVKLHRTSRQPMTPYAAVSLDAPQPQAAASAWPLPKVIRDTGPGVYYLWLPPASLVAP